MKALHTSTDWRFANLEIPVDFITYDVHVSCFLTAVTRSNAGNYGPPTEIEYSAEVEGWSSEPAVSPDHPHYKILDKLVEEKIAEYDWN